MENQNDIGKAEYTESNVQEFAETNTKNTEGVEVIGEDSIATGNGGAEEAQEVSGSMILTKHTVAKGETLVGICRKYYGNCGNMQVILELNQIDDENLIYEGQILYLP